MKRMNRVGVSLVAIGLPLCGQAANVCFRLNQIVQLQGKLTRVNENGYRQWLDLRPSKPICTLADPGDPITQATENVTDVQAGSADAGVDARLDRLVGKRVAVTGKLIQSGTGYQRAAVVLLIETVDPLSADGEAALRRVGPPPKPIREVAAYEITVRAGKSLVKEAREVGTNRRLLPTDAYAPQFATGGDVVYVNCRGGYTLDPGPATHGDVLSCDSDALNQCAFSTEHIPLTFTMRCVRKPDGARGDRRPAP